MCSHGQVTQILSFFAAGTVQKTFLTTISYRVFTNHPDLLYQWILRVKTACTVIKRIMSETDFKILHRNLCHCYKLHISKAFIFKGFQFIAADSQNETILITTVTSHLIPHHGIIRSSFINRYLCIRGKQFLSIANDNFISSVTCNFHMESSC